MIGFYSLWINTFDDYYQENQPFCLKECECCSNCTSVTCSDKMDIHNQPYQCIPEEVAQNWHKECLQPSENLCSYNGKHSLIETLFSKHCNVTQEGKI